MKGSFPTTCTDTPSDSMKMLGQTCADVDVDNQCNAPHQVNADREAWIQNKYCQKTCYELGNGYIGDDCSGGGHPLDPQFYTFPGGRPDPWSPTFRYGGLDMNRTNKYPRGLPYVMHAIKSPKFGDSMTTKFFLPVKKKMWMLTKGEVLRVWDNVQQMLQKRRKDLVSKFSHLSNAMDSYSDTSVELLTQRGQNTLKITKGQFFAALHMFADQLALADNLRGEIQKAQGPVPNLEPMKDYLNLLLNGISMLRNGNAKDISSLMKLLKAMDVRYSTVQFPFDLLKEQTTTFDEYISHMWKQATTAIGNELQKKLNEDHASYDDKMDILRSNWAGVARELREEEMDLERSASESLASFGNDVLDPVIMAGHSTGNVIKRALKAVEHYTNVWPGMWRETYDREDMKIDAMLEHSQAELKVASDDIEKKLALAKESMLDSVSTQEHDEESWMAAAVEKRRIFQSFLGDEHEILKQLIQSRVREMDQSVKAYEGAPHLFQKRMQAEKEQFENIMGAHIGEIENMAFDMDITRRDMRREIIRLIRVEEQKLIRMADNHKTKGSAAINDTYLTINNLLDRDEELIYRFMKAQNESVNSKLKSIVDGIGAAAVSTGVQSFEQSHEALVELASLSAAVQNLSNASLAEIRGMRPHAARVPLEKLRTGYDSALRDLETVLSVDDLAVPSIKLPAGVDRKMVQRTIDALGNASVADRDRQTHLLANLVKFVRARSGLQRLADLSDLYNATVPSVQMRLEPVAWAALIEQGRGFLETVNHGKKLRSLKDVGARIERVRAAAQLVDLSLSAPLPNTSSVAKAIDAVEQREIETSARAQRTQDALMGKIAKLSSHVDAWLTNVR
jgi:hypothetical protein